MTPPEEFKDISDLGLRVDETVCDMYLHPCALTTKFCDCNSFRLASGPRSSERTKVMQDMQL